MVVVVPTRGHSKLVPLIAEAHKIQGEVLSQMAKTTRLYLDTFQRRSEIWLQIKDIEVRQKQRTDSGFIHPFMNQPGYHQLSQNEQLAKRQDYERKNLEHSKDEQRKSSLQQENQAIDKTRIVNLEVMEHVNHVSSMLISQIVGFGYQTPDSSEE
jgi:hypothetical protein